MGSLNSKAVQNPNLAEGSRIKNEQARQRFEKAIAESKAKRIAAQQARAGMSPLGQTPQAPGSPRY